MDLVQGGIALLRGHHPLSCRMPFVCTVPACHVLTRPGFQLSPLGPLHHVADDCMYLVPGLCGYGLGVTLVVVFASKSEPYLGSSVFASSLTETALDACILL